MCSGAFWGGRKRVYVSDDENGNRVLTDYPLTKLAPELVVPGMHRKRTPEEAAELQDQAERECAERYCHLYEKLRLKVVAYPNGDLHKTWSGGRSEIRVSPNGVIRP